MRLRLLCIVAVSLAAGNAAADGLSVAAAASLNQVLQQLGTAYQREGGERLRVSYAASGVLARQIAHGAPFALFLSANERYVRFLAERGLTDDEGVVYALGELVLFVPQHSRLSSLLADQPAAAGGLALLQAALDAGWLPRLVIANPEHAPYGVAARDALQFAGLWPALKASLVLGENAAQAARFSVSGAADAGLIPRVLAQQLQRAKRGSTRALAAGSYLPLRQRVVTLAGAGASARRFVAFLTGPVAQRILLDSGFVLPDSR
jgi:molybdate transport system substrate-binding protein